MHHPQPRLTPGWNKRPALPAHAHLAISSAMPGWQIAVIATVVALLAAGLAVTVYRTRLARQRATTNTT